MTQRTASIERTLFELNRDARAALGAGNHAVALEKLGEAIELEPTSLSLRLNLAAAKRQARDLPGALAAVEKALTIDPRNFNALLLKGSMLEEAGDANEAGRVYGIALLFKPQGAIDPPTTAAIARAQRVHADYSARRAQIIDDALIDDPALADAATPPSVRRFLDAATGRARVYLPQPTQFHFPGLPSQEFFDRDLFPWLDAFETKTDAILAELMAVQRDRVGLFEPYVNQEESLPLDQWAELNRSDRWSALHIYRHGLLAPEVAELLPRTLEALQLLQQPEVAGCTPNAMFSTLQPRTRIPAHTGVSNARLVLHLPLIVPPGCGFRVGSETREWTVGKAWVFDDTIEHEAWNDSDDIRIILIADLWNVFMTDLERRAYTAVLAALNRSQDVDLSHTM